MSGAPAARVALAGWLPVVAIGVVQATAAVRGAALGARAVAGAPAGHCRLPAGDGGRFAAIVQWLARALGAAGRIVVLALLMLQLTSSGGTYPVQTSPGFFNAIHPFLPMTYVVDGAAAAHRRRARPVRGTGVAGRWPASRPRRPRADRWSALAPAPVWTPAEAAPGADAS